MVLPCHGLDAEVGKKGIQADAVRFSDAQHPRAEQFAGHRWWHDRQSAKRSTDDTHLLKTCPGDDRLQQFRRDAFFASADGCLGCA